jgi:hypothetical protein
MSSATRFVAVVSLVGLFVAARPAQDARSVGAATLSFFSDRAAFQAQAPTLALENFELGIVPSGGAAGCPGPLDATSNNVCFSTGSIQPGVRFNSDPIHDRCVNACELALLGQRAFGAPSKVLVANFMGDAFVIDFTGGNVGNVGADLVTYFTNSTCSIEIFGASGLLGSTTSPCTAGGVFWGVKSDQPITRIRLTVPNTNVVGVDNLAFGAGAPSTIHVALDVKPGSDPAPSPINPASQGVTPVAVLSTPDFDASQLDVSSLAFGAGGAPAMRDNMQDVNGDGLPDLVVHFSTPAAHISCGDTQLTMTGRTLSGRQVQGAGPIWTPGC